jgi:hypothetical protein
MTFCKFCGDILTPQVGSNLLTGSYYICDNCKAAVSGSIKIASDDCEEGFLADRLRAGSSKLTVTRAYTCPDSLSFDVDPAEISLSKNYDI